jgi:hypothetical protein
MIFIQNISNRHSRESGNLANIGKDSCLRRNDGNMMFLIYYIQSKAKLLAHL